MIFSCFPYSTKEFVQRHISEAYHDNIVEEVQVAYDVSKLSWLDQKRDNASKARIYCENNASKYGAGQQMKPAICGIMCMACNCTQGKCCQNSVDALTFYRKEEEDYTHEVTREKARVMTKSIGIAFVTFKRLVDAKRMAKDHQGKCRCFSNPTSSTLSNLLEPWNWSVRVSPPPEDIYWENLTESHRLFFFKTLVINFFLFILLFFLTSPGKYYPIILQLHEIFEYFL